MKIVRLGLALLLLVAGYDVDARECRSYGKAVGEVIGSKDVKVTATLSSPSNRSGYSFDSREPDAIEFQIYNGKPAQISIEVTFASGNVYDLNREMFPVRRASTFLLYPQKEDLEGRFSWKVREVISKCEEWYDRTSAEENRWFNLCMGYKSEPDMTPQSLKANALACRESAKNPTWIQRQLWQNF